MDELIAAAAERLGITPGLVQRSAAARAADKGVSAEALITEWAGGEAASAPAAGAAGDPPAAAPAAATAPTTEEPSGPKVEVLEPVAASDTAPAEEAPAPPPEPVAPTGRAALSGFPTWLAAAFLIVPAFALFYAMVAPDGPNCGVSGQLAVNPVTGEAENCDGTPYGVEVVDFFADGEEIFTGRCASCHGADGGGGAGPALAGGSVLATFPSGSCATENGHMAWVTLGSAGWPDPTYGALAKPVGGFGSNMPSFEGTLTPDEIASVTLYERVNFGGQALPEAIDDCGLGEEDAEVSAAP